MLHTWSHIYRYRYIFWYLFIRQYNMSVFLTLTKRLVKIWIPPSIHHLSTLWLSSQITRKTQFMPFMNGCASWDTSIQHKLWHFLRERKKAYTVFFCILTTVNTVQDVTSLQMFNFFNIIHRHHRCLFVFYVHKP